MMQSDTTENAPKVPNLILTNEFAEEEIQSDFGYVSGYNNARPVIEQMTILRAIFPQLESYDAELAAKEALAGTEGNFLVPDWRAIARSYVEAVQIVLRALAKLRNGRFTNLRENQLGAAQLKESVKKAAAFQRLREEQKGPDILVLTAQLGIRHRGKSVQRARVVMGGNEVGLGAFEAGIILLTNPDRLARWDDLYIDCAGDEYAPDANNVFCEAPAFCFDDWGLEFSTESVYGPLRYRGSASAFVLSE